MSGAWRSAAWRRRLAVALVLLGGLPGSAQVDAGGSPETTLVVVNAASPLSQRIANEYLRLRAIPETHLLRLSGVPSSGSISLREFRKTIWGPIRDYLREHGLEEEIDLIAYSGDFPYGVGFGSDIRGKKLPADRYRGGTASLTALTYFAQRVEAGDPGYVGVNHYFRKFVLPRRPVADATASTASRDGGHGVFESSHGFRHRYVWSNSDLRFWKPGDELDQYYLSTMLAYTGVLGNSLPEILRYLGRATASDGTSPAGTVYLMENDNVRSTTRQPLFAATQAELARRGRKAEILRRGSDGQTGTVPVGRDDVIGVVVGSAGFDWPKSKSRLLPGAIAESLTSYGGHFDRPKQTKLTEFLRRGAAGSSGAVEEPYSLQAKFPVPLLHAYYADGCSLAEAFYQSVLTPYQLLIVGDPLARPFARFADVGLNAPDVATPWSGTVRLEPRVKPATGTAIRSLELWIDGQHLSSAAGDAPITWNTRTVEDGSHDLRLVAVEDSLIETRSVFRATVTVRNRDRRIGVTEVTRQVAYGQPIRLAGSAEGAKRVEARRGHQVLGSAPVSKGQWSLTVPSDALGMGEVALVVRAEYPDGQAVRSEAVAVSIQEPALLPAATRERPRGEGLRAIVLDQAGTRHETVVGRLRGGLGKLVGGVSPHKVQLTGLLHVAEPGFYQLVIRGHGPVRLALHDRVLLDEALSPGGAERFVALGLEAGWHPLTVDLSPGGKQPSLAMVLAGAQAPVVLSKTNLGHH